MGLRNASRSCHNSASSVAVFDGAVWNLFEPHCLKRQRSHGAVAGLATCVLVSVFLANQIVRSDSAAFTAGNVLLLIPQGTTSAATDISLAEYSPSGTADQTVPVTGPCTMSASAISEGKLMSSYDGSSVAWSCYACAAGTASVASVRKATPPSPPLIPFLTLLRY